MTTDQIANRLRLLSVEMTEIAMEMKAYEANNGMGAAFT